MPTHAPSIAERHNIESGSWFAKLSPTLRQAILPCAHVRRLQDGELMASRGAPAKQWCGVALGAVRVSSVSLAGKQVSLTYVEPGAWFGDIPLFGVSRSKLLALSENF
jgi:CRP-like cAMP-binding protein